MSGGDRRSGERRTSDRRGPTDSDATPEPGRALAPPVTRLQDERVEGGRAAPEPSDPASPAAPVGPDPAFAAQIIGQGGQRNGIRGGPPVMDGARSAYLGAEYSGDRERRPPVGKAKRTDV